ncbi:MAG: DUF3644 domain-containing protein [Lentisphaerae bacterium]|nr:DUF3644 domain-containing protein [Lentisphaerota bacterium]MBT5605807.1 DUF3644 domain-containing protein [Lentisphaerota bacterium]MBT7055610.1 DUF3644 domain-containing protein [Lentisphaerota bacterium]MBT7846690.1 DUF3644 domain-containing protein [Lentisphaerota bacterium]MBT7913155.1 DUF3644 domain-containing protein [Candidatus Bathyarchaeota archaeon]
MRSRARQMLDKSVSSMLSAIEIYNKPNFLYREETFSILAVNAWELLLKARILQLGRNKISVILVYEHHTLRDGSRSQKLYRKKNRCGNHISLGLFKAFDSLVNDYGDDIEACVRSNLEALTEIRDNAVHFMNRDFDLRKTVHELGSASARNYLRLVRQWFGVDLREYNIFLMPIAFVRDCDSAEGIALNSQERKVLEFVRSLNADEFAKAGSEFCFSLDIDIRMRRTGSDGKAEVTLSNSPEAVPVRLEEEDIREKYPWDYKILSTRLRKRYYDFKENQDYHKTRKELEKDERFCKSRYLDPGNQRSSRKNFYNPNILKEFDRFYTRT